MLSDQRVTCFKALSQDLETDSEILNPRTAAISTSLEILVVERGTTLVLAVTSLLDTNPHL